MSGEEVVAPPLLRRSASASGESFSALARLGWFHGNGVIVPRSHRPTVDRSIPRRSASVSWVNPIAARRRARPSRRVTVLVPVRSTPMFLSPFPRSNLGATAVQTRKGGCRCLAGFRRRASPHQWLPFVDEAPVGPSSGRVANQTGVAARWSPLRVAFGTRSRYAPYGSEIAAAAEQTIVNTNNRRFGGLDPAYRASARLAHRRITFVNSSVPACSATFPADGCGVAIGCHFRHENLSIATLGRPSAGVCRPVPTELAPPAATKCSCATVHTEQGCARCRNHPEH